MNTKHIIFAICGAAMAGLAGCSAPALVEKKVNTAFPVQYQTTAADTANSTHTPWRNFFTDPYLIALIDTALNNNRELSVLTQEINMGNNEVWARKGAYKPFVGVAGGAGFEKAGRYTRNGAVDENLEIKPGKPIPAPLTQFNGGAVASWEIDIWKKLRNAQQVAAYKYLATQEGKNFMVSHLISEIANSYYDLLALDNQLTILRKNIEIQQNALEIVKLEKLAAKVTELAVKKFEAEVLKNQSTQYYITQQITETENRINFLTGRLPQPIKRNAAIFPDLEPHTIAPGFPAQLLENRPDIRQAALELSAAKVDIQVAKAYFYPSLNLAATLGLEAFSPWYLLTKPQSILYAFSAGMAGPWINKNDIQARYFSAGAKQSQAVSKYEQTLLTAFTEVSNQLSNIQNLKKSYALKKQQVDALNESINISVGLFRSARADYMEVLLTQRDAIEAKFELIETKKQQMTAVVNLYKALGGGWK